MKKILILSCLFLFFVSSCSNQEEVIVGDDRPFARFRLA